MVDFPKFFTTAAELYGLWPSFFNWATGLILPILAGLVTATWWMRGYKADAREAVLEGEKVALRGQLETERAASKGQIDVLQQRLALATEQQKVAESEAERLAAQLAESRESDDASKEAKIATTNLDVTLGRLLSANNAVTSTLTFSGARGVPLVPPLRKKD